MGTGNCEIISNAMEFIKIGKSCQTIVHNSPNLTSLLYGMVCHSNNVPNNSQQFKTLRYGQLTMACEE